MSKCTDCGMFYSGYCIVKTCVKKEADNNLNKVSYKKTKKIFKCNNCDYNDCKNEIYISSKFKKKNHVCKSKACNIKKCTLTEVDNESKI